MSKCFNPDCLIDNYPQDDTCKNCGSKLLIKNRYRAIRIIGEGGFGRTFYGIDESQAVNSQCVIKQSLPQAQGTTNRKKAKALFTQEAKQLEKLGANEQIPKFFDYFSQDNRQYLLQEFIDGDNLAQELALEGVFKEKKIRKLLLNILPVLKFLHENQVIHRDIKPENIIRRRRDNQLFLVDFGASKVLQNQDVGVTGTIIGSAQYCAPEQSFGKANYYSDLYSLGVTCLYLATGVEPFYLFDTSEGQWVWRDYLVDNPIGEDLGRVLDKLVVGASNKRFQTVDEVLEALGVRESLLCEEDKSSANSFYERGNHYLEVQNYKNALDCFENVIRIDSGFVLAYQRRDFASMQLAKINRKNNLSLRVKKMLQVSPFIVSGAIALYALLPTSGGVVDYVNPEDIESVEISSPDLQPSQYYELGNRAYSQGRYDVAIIHYSSALRQDPAYVDAYNNRGISYSALEEYDKAIADYERIMELDPSYMRAYYNRGNAYKAIGEEDKAIVDYLKAIELDPTYTNAYYNLGNTYRELGEQERAIALYDQVIAIDPDYINAHYNRSIANYALNNYQESIKDNTEVLRIDDTHTGALLNRGNSHFALNNYPQAMADYNKALEIDPDYQIAYYNRANVHRVLGHYQRAIVDYQKSIQLNPQHLDSYNNMALSYEQMGDIDQAIKEYQRAIDLDPNYQLAIDNLNRLQSDNP
ncbi:tetratricopeptide repeat protein [Cyanobacterium stanieri LEGE 03274]|uniref:Tetratricopeptide repeat protein n=1 Tax=Cyanobacterium stanieri LEGE 03274 TaxID=1828756 RepID=A0ABR9V6V3_9CHRO|nr:serine/threonine-protein kinase [Cyanobacterium stanieri]MBE9223619.1 tetratricopeptide repeat protein [Cyanobacterium stanieri LEGE 03274]